MLDAKEILEAPNKKCDWAINPVILDIRCLISSFFKYVRFIFAPNEEAHLLAKLSYFLK